MDSYFHPTIRPPSLRQAERTDTRQAIRRQENKDGRRKKSRRSLEDLDNDDETVVSVESLRVFLLSLLEQGAQGQTDADRQRYAVPETQQPNKSGSPKAKPPMAARAAQAYQSAYNASHPAEEGTPMTAEGTETDDGDRSDRYAAPITPSPAAEKTLSDKDRDVVTDLIEDLDFLISHNLHEMAIRRKGDLLQSIMSTVKAHKTLIKSR